MHDGKGGTARRPVDVVLVQPNIVWAYDPFEHLGLAYLASTLRADGFSVQIVDGVLEEMTFDELYGTLDGLDIGVLGVTLISHGYPQTVRFLEDYRAAHPGTAIVAGGHFATFAAAKIHAHTDVFDAIVLGEGELAFRAYCRRMLRGGDDALTDVCLRGEEPLRVGRTVDDLDELPDPHRDLLPLAMERGARASIASSRGCYARCSFCSVHNFYRLAGSTPWRPRSVQRVVAELRSLHERFGIERFMFVDDNFIGPGKAGRDHAVAFAEAYGESGLPMTFHVDCRAVDVDERVIAALHAVGLRSVFVGVESVAADDLVAYRKGLRAERNWAAVEILNRYGLEYTLSMIMFNPATTPQSILDNVAFLRWARYYPRNPLSILNLYEGTDLLERYREHATGPFWNYRFEFADPRTRRIYAEALRFCKGSLALERRLSRGGDAANHARALLYRLRLGHLQDAAAHLDEEPAAGRLARWDARVAALADGSTTPDDDLAPPDERRYLTGSLDSPVDLVPNVTIKRRRETVR
jgi:anaerobic magnesium-protoporphyrin IX monomethyl ester cyclase